MSKMTTMIKKWWNSRHKWPVIIAVIVGIIIGLLIGPGGPSSSSGHPGEDHGALAGEAGKGRLEVEFWTCSMHPQIRQPKPGKCPICFMDLVPVSTAAQDSTDARELKLSPRAISLADIRLAPVERRFLSREIRLVGTVVFDETRLAYITARVPGRIDRLYVDYTGMRVRKGDHLIDLYSPDLLTAQQELLQAVKSAYTASAAREKLRLWGLTPEQIKDIEKKGRPAEHMTLYSPISGIVTQKSAIEGEYVQTGSKIFTIADLSQVWVKLDAYESDLPWLRYAQEVEFETEAFPGEIFTGKIAFIDPVLDPHTRTVKVRVNVPNPAGKLKPEMFVRSLVRSRLSGSGKVMDPHLAGKWLSPMHPEIVKDGPGRCDICGMPLVRAEELGYLSPGKAAEEAPLVMPASAPLITGKRAVVYVAVPGKEGTFAGKEVVLGPRAGDHYIIKEGLEEGEKVVVNGAFKIDSDLQIQAKPSMMSPQHGEPEPRSPKGESAPAGEKIPAAFRQSMDLAAAAYFDIQQALSSDNLAEAQKGGENLLIKLAAVDMKLLSGSAHGEWLDLAKNMAQEGKKLIQSKDIEEARLQLERLTGPMTAAIKSFGSKKSPVYRFHCPMAFNNKGAYWLQKSTDTRNPYFGASMLLCKDKVETLVEGKK